MHSDLFAVTNIWYLFCLNQQVAELSWTDVQGWAGAGGARLRTTRSLLCFLVFLPDFWPTVLSVVSLVQCVICRLSSVSFCIVAKRYVLAKKCLKE